MDGKEKVFEKIHSKSFKSIDKSLGNIYGKTQSSSGKEPKSGYLPTGTFIGSDLIAPSCERNESIQFTYLQKQANQFLQ